MRYFKYIILFLVIGTCLADPYWMYNPYTKKPDYYEIGAVGPTGPAGADGSNGMDGANGTNGSCEGLCTNGNDGAQGPAGADGAQGPAGSNGKYYAVQSPLYEYSYDTIGIYQAGSSSDGYLSSSDWNTFNNKLSAGGYSGDIYCYDGTSTTNNLHFSNGILTGIN